MLQRYPKDMAVYDAEEIMATQHVPFMNWLMMLCVEKVMAVLWLIVWQSSPKPFADITR